MFNDDNSSTVSPGGNSPQQQAQPEPPQFHEPVLQEAKKSNRAARVLGVLLILALLGAGAMAYMWYTAAQSQEEFTSKIEQLEQENNQLKAEPQAQTTDPNQAAQGDASSPVASNGREALEKTLAATAKLEVKASGDKPSEYEITKFDDNFAMVKLGSEDAATSSVYKQVDGLWFGVWVGNNVVSKCVGERFGLPDSYYDKTVKYDGETC